MAQVDVIPRYALIDATGNWDGVVNSPDSPEPGEGARVAEIPAGWSDDPATTLCTWSTQLGGWVDVVRFETAPLLSIAAFMLLFTQAERVSLRAARATDPIVDDFWELMLACVSGISLQHPVVIAGVQHLVNAALLTSDRQTEILSGTLPA